MDEVAYQQYRRESENWLKAARGDLLARMVGKATGGRKDLEILDMGAGVGQNIPVLLQFGVVDVLEINEIGLQALRAIDGIREIFDQPVPFALDRRYDVIIATDVLEHIEDDKGAARWVAEHLKPGGVFFSTVPAYQFLFSEHDVALHHFRRYTAGNYAAIMEPQMKVERCGYFNSILFPIAAAARLFSRLRSKARNSGPAQKQSSVVPGPVDRFFRLLLSLEIKMIEKRVGLPFGLSVYCLARRHN